MVEPAPAPKLEERRRVLVAGIGNIFLGDDGFGVEVARRLRDEPMGEDVDVADFGIRGVHLACELADGGYHTVILVDAVSRGGPPGTLYVIEPDAGGRPLDDCSVADAHALTPAAVLAWAARMGSSCNVLVIGCEAGSVDEAIGLSPEVAAAVPGAVQIVRDRLAGLFGGVPCA